MRALSDFRLFLFIAAFAAAPFAMAQYAQKNTPPPAQDTRQSAPPAEELELIDEVEQPTITIRKPDAAREITERKEHGMTKEIKVQTGGSTYYLYPNDPLGGNFRDNTSTIVRPALWRVHEFDMTDRPDTTNNTTDQEPDYTSDAPAPPEAK
ncbi:MAG: hypothetical protein LBM56_01645 [Burkholderiaceae bacterium]|jgi:hypothetical protein|nr:hypothetical protein [Burkholderiaceae bacterium]